MGKFVIKRKVHELRQKYFITRKVALANGAQKAFSVYMGAVIIIFGLAYVWQINNTATLGYQMKDLEYKASELATSTHGLRVKIAEVQSTARVLERLEGTGMVPVGNVAYLSALSSEVALR